MRIVIVISVFAVMGDGGRVNEDHNSSHLLLLAVSTEQVNISVIQMISTLAEATPDSLLSNSTQVPSVDAPEDAIEERLWVVVVNYVHIIICSAGVLANVITLVVLQRSRNDFGRTILYLLKHLACVDALSCFFSMTPYMIPEELPYTHYILDKLLCYTWQGQMIYFFFLAASVPNILLIAVDRFLFVVKPFSHPRFTPFRAKVGVMIFYCYALFNAINGMLQVQFKDGRCVHEPVFNGPRSKLYFTAWAVLLWLMIYVLPSLVLIILYGGVVHSVRKMQRGSNEIPGLFNKASSQLTKTAIIVSSIYVLTIGYALTYFMLGMLGVVRYVIGSPEMRLGVVLSAINTSCNPFIYPRYLPVYRRFLRRAMPCYRSTPSPVPEAYHLVYRTRSL